MIRPEDIPPEVVEAVTALFEPGYLESIGLHPESIAAAAIKAWPGALEQQFYELTPDGKQMTFPVIILPLPQKEPTE